MIQKFPSEEDRTAGQGQLLGHDYDGIQEYDNPLPGWWVFLFWACIVFAPFYVAYYHLGAGNLVAEEYAEDVEAYNAAEAERLLAMGDVTDEMLRGMTSNPAILAEARVLYDQHCKSCHLEQGQGQIGPNLTDDYWIHGGAPLAIHDTIMNGVEGKGMEAWGLKLPPAEIRKLTAFVLSIRGSNPPNPKAPEGELFVESP